MGGLAGHMSHLYGDTELKISELIGIIQQVASGEMIYNEKADGQNIYATMDAQRNVYFARNQGDIKKLGRSAQEIGSEYMGKGMSAQAEIFGDGCHAIEQILQSLSDETANLIFGDPQMPKTYINCEIIHMDHPNMVMYEKYHIQFHELEVDPADEFPEVAERFASKENRISGLNIQQKKFQRLLSEVAGSSVKIVGQFGNTTGKEMEFTIDGPQFLPPKTETSAGEELVLFQSQADNAVSQIKALVNSAGLNETNTVGDYIIAKLEDEVLPAIGVPEAALSDISNFIVYGTDANGVKILSKTARASGGVETAKPFREKLIPLMGKEMAEKLTMSKYSSFQNGLMGPIIGELKEVIHSFSVSVLDGVESAIAKDPGLARHATAATLSDIQGLRNALISDYETEPDKLERYLSKFDRELSLLGDISKFNQSMEGVVINYVREDGMPVLYKLTGLFAPANQIVGSSKSGFDIKRRLLQKARQEYNSLPYTPEPDIVPPASPLQETIRRMIRESIRRNLIRR